MFILSVTYVAPIEEIDRHLPAHVTWLKEGHANGRFLAWGRKVPRVGGIILAVGERSQVEALAQSDPFIVHGVATVEVIEMTPSFVVPGLEALTQ
jgi:uncharacterized protein YciI